MARDHARLFTSIWSDPDWRSLTGDEQRAYMMVLSDPGLNYCGVTAITVKRWAQQASDTTEKTLRKAFAGLEAKRYLVFDWDTEEVLVRALLRRDKVLCVPNVAKSAFTSWRAVLSPRIRAAVLVELARIQDDPEAFRDAAVHAVKEWFNEPVPEGLP